MSFESGRGVLERYLRRNGSQKVGMELLMHGFGDKAKNWTKNQGVRSGDS